MKIRSGELTERIGIYSINNTNTDESDIFSGLKISSSNTENYVLKLNLRAGLKWKTGDEVYIDGQTNPVQAVRFKIRYNTNVLEPDLVKWKGSFFDIRFIEHERTEGVTYLHVEKRRDNGS